jgi:predicted RNA-binding Zn-ribbon protein involved in translation (DUF1610 family)
VLVLRCKACTAELPAASNDVAFRCPQCGRTWEILHGSFREWNSVYVAPPSSTSHPIVYLPYWSFTVDATALPMGPGHESMLTARDKANFFKRAWVSAFAIYRPTYIGEWGIVYTRLQPDFEVRSGHGPEAPGAAVGSLDATKIATHYILGEIDRAADLGGLDIDLELGDPELWAIPCYDMGEKIRCPWTRAELPAAALDDLSEIRRASERLEA